ITTHVIAAAAVANGSVTPAAAVTVNDRGSQSFTITPAAHYHILDVRVDGVSQGAIAGYAFGNVTADHSIVATFEITTHVIAASEIGRASCRAGGVITVDDGAGKTVTITP